MANKMDRYIDMAIDAVSYAPYPAASVPASAYKLLRDIQLGLLDPDSKVTADDLLLDIADIGLSAVGAKSGRNLIEAKLAANKAQKAVNKMSNAFHPAAQARNKRLKEIESLEDRHFSIMMDYPDEIDAKRAKDWLTQLSYHNRVKGMSPEDALEAAKEEIENVLAYGPHGNLTKEGAVAYRSMPHGFDHTDVLGSPWAKLQTLRYPPEDVLEAAEKKVVESTKKYKDNIKPAMLAYGAKLPLGIGRYITDESADD